MSRSRYSLVSLDDLKSSWGAIGFEEVANDESDVRALIGALQEATRQVEDYCGVRFVPFLGSFRRELDGNLYGSGSIVEIAPFLRIDAITIGDRDILSTTIQIIENDDIDGVADNRVETLSLRDNVGTPSETLVVSGILGYSDTDFDLPFEMSPLIVGATYKYNATGENAETISIELAYGTDDEDFDSKYQRVIDLLSGRVVAFGPSNDKRFVSLGEAVKTDESDVATTIYFRYSLLDPNIIDGATLTEGDLATPQFYRAPIAIASIIKARAVKIYNSARGGYMSDEPEANDPLRFTQGERDILSAYRYQTMFG